jgi:hypothetical protein
VIHADEAARLGAELARLTERCAALQERLANASHELAATGAMPHAALGDELDAVRSQFADLRRITLDFAVTAGVPSDARAQDVSSLRMLHDVLQTVVAKLKERAEAQAKHTATRILDRVLELEHREQPQFPPLQPCRAQAQELRQAITSADDQRNSEIAQLAEGQHGLAQLVELVEHLGDLDDGSWQALHDAIAEKYGRPLAVSAARGKLAFSPTSPDDDEDRWPTLRISAPDAEEPPRSALVWEALLRDRPALAFLAGQYVAAGDGISIPLLRALTLSRHVRYVNGDIALQIADDLAACAETDRGAVEGQAEAVRLLIIAAALRPALVAPDTGAWAILREFSNQAEQPHFQRFVRAVAEYGERHPPLPPGALAPAPAPAIWRDTLEDLLREIAAWRVRFLGMRTSYPPATEVWRQWLRPDGLVHGLLRPLTADHFGLETSRGLVERLANETQIDWEIADTDRRLLERAHGPDIASRRDAVELLRERVRETVDFARRWIALQEHRPGHADDESRQSGRQLSRQLDELHAAAADELARQPGAASLALRAALTQCQAALASVHALVESDHTALGSWSQRVREPQPTVLLYSDLLRVPGIRLDREWRPLPSEHRLLARGLSTLVTAAEQPDWRAAFESHRQRRDHLATGQVLQCLETRDDERGLADIAELRRLRIDDLQRCRADLRREVENVRELVDVAAAEGRLGDETRARLLAIVEHIGIAIPNTLRFEFEYERLSRVRDELERSAAANFPDELGSDARSEERTRLRAAELSALAAPDGPRLLVGGSGMGVSTILRAVARSQHAPEHGHRALLLDLAPTPADDSDGAVERPSSDRLSQLLTNWTADLAHGAGSTPLTADDDAVLLRVHSWLNADPDRRLWLLFDNADRILDEETTLATAAVEQSGFATSSRLARLMDATGGRVKVVLGGSLATLRAARHPQHPLAGHGYVQLRPLLDCGGWIEAGALLLQSLAPTTPDARRLVARLLSVANYVPGSIQRLGHELSQRAEGARLTASTIDNFLGSRDGARVLTANLQATLAADPRHAIVLYRLALACWCPSDSVADVGSEGVASAWLAEQVTQWCPHAFGAAMPEESFPALLDEMVALGLLRSTSTDRYTLAAPNLVPYLGGEEELMGTLLDVCSRAEAGVL